MLPYKVKGTKQTQCQPIPILCDFAEPRAVRLCIASQKAYVRGISGDRGKEEREREREMGEGGKLDRKNSPSRQFQFQSGSLGARLCGRRASVRLSTD